MDDEILTICELAAPLNIGQRIACTMAQSGELPVFKVRAQSRCRRADIDAWIEKQVHPDSTHGERDE